MKHYIEFKWGSVVAWRIEGNQPAIDKLNEWAALGTSMSAMFQHNTPEQKKLLVELIDLVGDDCEFWLAWDDVAVSREKAKKYIEEYDDA